MKERIVSGIQPSGLLHIGNYLGALKDFVQLQDEYECYFFIADLHSLTEDYSPSDKPKQILDLLKTFLAVGLDPDKSTIFIQSHIPAHTELAWIFETLTPIGELQRMTQYKDKGAKQKHNINAGLFNYPVLQAADILLYHPQYVPVGADQMQHLETTNFIARRFNNRFGQTFKEIKPYIQKPIKIRSLSDPEKKMSKSEPNSMIGIFDDPEVIRQKLAKAVTATDAPEGTMPAGIANLFQLLLEFGGQKIYNSFIAKYEDKTIQYSELKEALSKAISDYFAPMREKRSQLENDSSVMDAIKKSTAKAKKIAEATLETVKGKIGLV